MAERVSDDRRVTSVLCQEFLHLWVAGSQVRLQLIKLLNRKHRLGQKLKIYDPNQLFKCFMINC